MKAKLYLLFFFVQLITAMEIEISITNQELILRDDSGVIKTYKISTSKFGEGSKENSFKTPLGKHEIKKMIGKDVIIGGRFIGRVHTGDVFPIYSDQEIYVKEDVVQSRILWLSGLENNINKDKSREIKILRSSKYIVIVSGGIGNGDWVMTTPVSNAIDGMKVEVYQESLQNN